MKTQLQRPSAGKARYTPEYKQQALEQWRLSGRSAARRAKRGVWNSWHKLKFDCGQHVQELGPPADRLSLLDEALKRLCERCVQHLPPELRRTVK